MEIGELLGAGRSADVYAIGGGLVLRRYRHPFDARREAEVMAYLAGRGYPVPEVRPGDHGPADLVMERLPGPTMLHAVLAGAGDGGPGTRRRWLRGSRNGICVMFACCSLS